MLSVRNMNQDSILTSLWFTLWAWTVSSSCLHSCTIQWSSDWLSGTYSVLEKSNEIIARVLGLRDCRLVMAHSAITFKLPPRSRRTWQSGLLKQGLALYKITLQHTYFNILPFLRNALAWLYWGCSCGHMRVSKISQWHPNMSHQYPLATSAAPSRHGS